MMTKEQIRAYRAEWSRNRRKNRSPELAIEERAKECAYRKERLKFPEVKKSKLESGRKATRKYREHLSPEKKSVQDAQKREHMRQRWLVPEVREARKKYRETSEVMVAHVGYARVYQKKYPEKVLALCHKRRARMVGAGGSYTAQEWFDLVEHFDHRCLMCGRTEPEIKLTVDHVIPIAKGGTSDISNIQPLCKHCNCTKHLSSKDYRF